MVAVSEKNLFSFHSGWAIGSLNNKFCANQVGILFIDGLFHGSWNKDITELDKNFTRAHRLLVRLRRILQLQGMI